MCVYALYLRTFSNKYIDFVSLAQKLIRSVLLWRQYFYVLLCVVDYAEQIVGFDEIANIVQKATV